MTFGDKVKELRNKADLSQTELANAVGVTRQTIMNYEKGISYPQDRSIYFKLAEQFSVDSNYLLTENEEFLTVAAEQFGKRGQAQADEILEQAAALFAGGELSDTDQIAFLNTMQSLYLEAKGIARDKFTPKKYKKGKLSSEE